MNIILNRFWNWSTLPFTPTSLQPKHPTLHSHQPATKASHTSLSVSAACNKSPPPFTHMGFEQVPQRWSQIHKCDHGVKTHKNGIHKVAIFFKVQQILSTKRRNSVQKQSWSQKSDRRIHKNGKTTHENKWSHAHIKISFAKTTHGSKEQKPVMWLLVGLPTPPSNILVVATEVCVHSG